MRYIHTIVSSSLLHALIAPTAYGSHEIFKQIVILTHCTDPCVSRQMHVLVEIACIRDTDQFFCLALCCVRYIHTIVCNLLSVKDTTSTDGLNEVLN
jgi:hypothetical protein